MALIKLRSGNASPLTIEEVDSNFINLNTDIGVRLLASQYTAADVLTKIKSVDGTGSGLDADLLNGFTSNYTNVPYTIVSRDSGGSFAAQTITAVTFSGPLTGNVTGNLTGNTTGLHTGNVVGNLTGDVTGQTYGVHHGQVVGDVIGDVTGNTTGLHTGNVVGNVTGNATGNAGTVTNGLYSTGSYSNPSWITSLAGSKVTSIPNSSLQNSSININGTSISLGSSATIPTGIKAWVVFNGSNGTIISSYNVNSVQVLSSGQYQVNIAPGTFADGNYCVSGILSDNDHVLNWRSSTATTLVVTTSDTHADANNSYSTTQRVNVMMIA